MTKICHQLYDYIRDKWTQYF